MGTCQGNAGVIIKANSRDNLEKNNLNSEKYQLDPKFEDMPEWPCK